MSNHMSNHLTMPRQPSPSTAMTRIPSQAPPLYSSSTPYSGGGVSRGGMAGGMSGGGGGVETLINQMSNQKAAIQMDDCRTTASNEVTRTTQEHINQQGHHNASKKAEVDRLTDLLEKEEKELTLMKKESKEMYEQLATDQVRRRATENEGGKGRCER